MAPVSLRLTYRRADESDASFIRTLEQDQAVRRFIGGLRAGEEPGSDHFVILKEGLRVGAAGFVPSEAWDGEDYELYCTVVQPEREGDIATEACEALLAWAWAERTWARVLACIDAANEAPQGLARKVGFAREGAWYSDPKTLVFVCQRPVRG
jgi:RimJ/RimL family protein N-acetyltransferase